MERAYYKKLIDAEAAALAISNTVETCVGVFQNVDTLEFYASHDCNEIRFCDTFVIEFTGGEVGDINPKFYQPKTENVVYAPSACNSEEMPRLDIHN